MAPNNNALGSRTKSAKTLQRNISRGRAQPEAADQQALPSQRKSSRILKEPDRYSPSQFIGKAGTVKATQPQLVQSAQIQHRRPTQRARKQLQSRTVQREASVQQNPRSTQPEPLREELVDLKNFQEEILDALERLTSNTEALSLSGPPIDSLGNEVERLLLKFVEFGYSPSYDMAPKAGLSTVSTGSSAPSVKSRANASANMRINQLGAAEKAEKLTFSSLTQEHQWYVLQNYQIGPHPTMIINFDESFPNEVKSDVSKYTEQDWQRDKRKSYRSNEQMFQCTIMIMSINRHNFDSFAEDKGDLDWSVGLEWESEHPPRWPKEKIFNYDTVTLSRPKPDLVVGFRPERVYSNYHVDAMELPNKLDAHMQPEIKASDEDQGRAFPFFIIEANRTGPEANINESKIQASNDAAHALFNIWQFMKRDESLKKEFFAKVKVFAAGGHSNDLWVRVYEPYPTNSIACPLGYRFKTVTDLKELESTQANIQLLFKKIMCWGIDDLLPLLRRAVDEASKQEKERIKESEQALSRPAQAGPAAQLNVSPTSSQQEADDVIETPNPEPDVIVSSQSQAGGTLTQQKSAGNKRAGEHGGQSRRGKKPATSRAVNESFDSTHGARHRLQEASVGSQSGI